MEIKSSQKEKLRKLLEKISTPEEMKSFDMELLAKSQEKTSEKIVEAIEKNKTEINWSFVENLINKTKESLSEKIEEIKKEFSNKKYPIYDDSEIQKKIDLILNESKCDKFIQEANKKSQNQVIEELITIGDLLVSIRDISNQPKDESESFLMINKSLEGIGGILQKILSFTGSNDSTRLKDSNGTVVNPSTSDNQATEIIVLNGIKTDIETGNNTLDQINSKTQIFTITEAISTSSFDINAAPYSSTTNINVDYKLDSIEIHFSTAQAKTITVTSSKGTIIYTDNNTLTDIFLNNLNLPFKANENFTITVTQTAGACLMNLYARTITGTANVLGTTQLVDYDMEVDDTGTYYYIGKASVGSATSSAVWQIFRFDSLGNKRFADNTSNYSKVWDNRASYTYLN